MPHILFVHGMNVERRSRDVFERNYFGALISNLRAAFPDEAANLPTAEDCSLLYWTDLLPPFEVWSTQTKGIADELEKLAAERVRELLRRAAEKTNFDPEQVALWHQGVRVRLEQTVLYINNVMELRTRILEGFRKLVRSDTCTVIGHSLGSVIAYEGLVSSPHSVDLFVSIGSPLGTPNLIYEHLAPHAWPDVRRWSNYGAVADVWSVPTPALDGLFAGNIHDVTDLRHGSLFDLSTHRLDKYLEHRPILDDVRRAWRDASGLR